MTISGEEVKKVVHNTYDRVSPADKLDLQWLLLKDPYMAYIKAKTLSELYWMDDIEEYAIDGCEE